MDIFSRQHRKVVLYAAFLVAFLLLFLVAHSNMNSRLKALTNGMSTVNNDQHNSGRSNVQRISSNKDVKTQRLPDVIIVGVKKSGTITLTKFLDYHPYIAAAGEISFFEKGMYLFLIKFHKIVNFKLHKSTMFA